MFVNLPNEAMHELTVNKLPDTRPRRQSQNPLLRSPHAEQKATALRHSHITPLLLTISRLQCHSAVHPNAVATLSCGGSAQAATPSAPGRRRYLLSALDPLQPHLLLKALCSTGQTLPRPGPDIPQGRRGRVVNVLVPQDRTKGLHPGSGPHCIGSHADS